MPGRIFTEPERTRLDAFPSEIGEADLIRYFTLCHMGFRDATREDFSALADWLLTRALEHDKPSLLFQLACEHLHAEKIIRPGVTRIERLVMETPERGHRETFRQLVSFFTEERLVQLDLLLVREEQLGRTPLVWLGERAAANTSKAIVAELKKLDFLRELGVTDWDLSTINPNRFKFLAQIGRRATGWICCTYLQQIPIKVSVATLQE